MTCRRGAGRGAARQLSGVPTRSWSLIRRRAGLAAHRRGRGAGAGSRTELRFISMTSPATFICCGTAGGDESDASFPASGPARRETLARLALVAATAITIRSGLAVLLRGHAGRGDALDRVRRQSSFATRGRPRPAPRSPAPTGTRRTGRTRHTRRLLMAWPAGSALVLLVGHGRLVGDGKARRGRPGAGGGVPGCWRVKPENPGGMQVIGANEQIMGSRRPGCRGATRWAPPPRLPDPQALRAQKQPPSPPVAGASRLRPAPAPAAAAAATGAHVGAGRLRPGPHRRARSLPPLTAAGSTASPLPDTPAPRGRSAQKAPALALPASVAMLVQLAAVDSEAAAQTEWQRLVQA